VQVINICTPGYFDIADSYGIIGINLIRQLAGAGLYVNGYALRGIDKGSQPDDVRAILGQPRVPTFGGIFLGYPVNYHQHGALIRAGTRVALTMFESSKSPQAWSPILNVMDAVVTPSRFCRDVFRDCGVTAPIHVVPLGLSPVYQPRQGPRPDRPLTFLAFLDRGRRKGGLLALNAFVRAFGERDDVHLILKAREAQSIGKPALQVLNPNVTVVAQDMSEAELYALFLSADVLISPATGEGFGLIPREACATGCIVFATKWSGTAEDIDAWGWPLPYQLVKADWAEARNLAGQALGVWAKPDIDGIVSAMRNVASNREWYAALALAKAQKIHDLYSWQRFGKEVYEIWEGVAHDCRKAA
jgi:glycosyltransferase involved in cell wall biosynthesis